MEQILIDWSYSDSRMPLLLRGARQVGKTYLIEQFGKTRFKEIITINLELEKEFITCFNNLDPQTIINSISLLSGKKIEAGNTLLFLDEIQECPNAILALRYFKEKMPELHVIGTGSLLEFVLNDAKFRMPVGRVQSLYLKPLSFKEYLLASGHQNLREFIEEINLITKIPEAVHLKLLSLIKEYMILGGMPAVIQEYLRHRDLYEAQQRQTVLLQTYRNDFGKYTPKINPIYLQKVYEKAPGLVAQHFKYVNVDSEMRSRDLKMALEMLCQAGLIYTVYATSASGLPLISLINEKKFKILFLDIGLVMRSTRLQSEILLKEDVLLINRGELAEQFVGQELLAYSPYEEEAHLYFWQREERSSQAEIDFITNVESQIIPIEVKAGATGRLKSLHAFLKEKNIPLGIRVSQHPLSLHDSILSIPLYMVSEISRLVSDAFKI